MNKVLNELRTGKADNGKNEWPKTTPKIALFYTLIAILVLEYIFMSLLLCYLLYQLVSDFCQRETNACEKWFLAGHIKFTEYTKALFGDNSCLICAREFHDLDNMVQLRCSSTHIYHYDCLRALIEAGKTDCPTCGASIL